MQRNSLQRDPSSGAKLGSCSHGQRLGCGLSQLKEGVCGVQVGGQDPLQGKNKQTKKYLGRETRGVHAWGRETWKVRAQGD